MRLTGFTDYALRLMMMVASAGEQLVTIDQAAKRHHISKAHLMKVANELTSCGLLTAVRGRFGGLKLAKPATQILLADIVRRTEPNFAYFECFQSGSECILVGNCKLPRVLKEADAGFFAVLEKHTLADVMATTALV